VTTVQTSSAVLPSAAKRSYGQILKSSALIGGSSLISIGLAMVRTKVLAVLLGKTGMGLFGLYSSVYELTRSCAGLGVNSSGVRQIAEAAGTQEPETIARTVFTLRRVALFTGLFGALILIVFRTPISRLTFNDPSHSGAVALLGLAIFFAEVSAGQAALVQGLRRIADLARMNVLGAIYGTALSIPLIYFLREKGIVPSLVAVAAMSILTSWWYARRVTVQKVFVSLRGIMREASALLKLGFVFMSSGLMAMGVAYLVRIMVVRQIDLAAAGLYQAAWSLGGLYFGFILQAMGADFYPRLTAVAKDNPECNRLVNEQAEVGLLLAVPGVLATLALAPLVMLIFYSQEFAPAVGILRWICLGMVLRVASWPMGFILVAKGEGKLFFVTELFGSLLQVALMWVGLTLWGLTGTGTAFFALYVFYTCGIYCVVRKVSGFRWSAVNARLALLFVPTIAAVFAAACLLPPLIAAALGLGAALVTGRYSLRLLCSLVPLSKLPPILLKLIRFLRLADNA
jgi:enterobacterial common antigen flippase